jgi:hypothetical protein
MWRTLLGKIAFDQTGEDVAMAVVGDIRPIAGV